MVKFLLRSGISAFLFVGGSWERVFIYFISSLFCVLGVSFVSLFLEVWWREISFVFFARLFRDSLGGSIWLGVFFSFGWFCMLVSLGSYRCVRKMFRRYIYCCVGVV